MARMVLSDGEWRIMNLLWKDAPLRVPEITERLRTETGWSRATVNMMLARLEEKGAVKSEAVGRSKEFRPLLTQEEARGRETARFLDRLYEGSLGLMVSSLAGQKGLSRDEIRELYAILEKAEKEKEGEDA